MNLSNWSPIIFLFVVLCSYSIYYNITHGTIDPHAALHESRVPDGLPHKIDVCVALRDRLLNVHRVGFVPADSPVHNYWEQLNCLALDLPPIGVDGEGNTGHSPNADTDPRLIGIDDIQRNTAKAREICTYMKVAYTVKPSVSWGTLSDEMKDQWVRLNCSPPSADDDDKSETAAPTNVVKAPLPVTKESVDNQIEDGKKDALSESPKASSSNSCRDMKTKYDIVPGKSWGTMDAQTQMEWSYQKCDKFFSSAELLREEAAMKKQAEDNLKILNKVNNKNKGKNSKDLFTDKDWCMEMKSTYKVMPMQSWGALPQNMVETWKSKRCDVVFTKLRMEASSISKCEGNENDKNYPLIAIMAGTTSRKMTQPSIEMMSLFTYLFPSLVRSLDCGYRYIFVLGYDKGDKFYDNEEGQNEVNAWFVKNVQKVLQQNGMKITLLPVKINNSIKKPGPVFIGMARAAFNAGADYFYRLNDDTEIAGHWPKVFVNALHTLSPPYGVVGPICKQGNQGILTHDFVHRVHMEIFEMNYYPPELVDWWMDDWISVVYGFKRTYEAKQSPVVHHTGAHGQRYEVDRENFKSLAGLVTDGRQRIKKWMLKHNATAAQLRDFETDNFSFKRRQAAPDLNSE